MDKMVNVKNKCILYLLIHCMIKDSFESFCSSTQPVKHAFNIGLNVFIDDHWFYDTANKKLLDTKYESLHLFGSHVQFRFQWITTGFSLIFNDCKPYERDNYCVTVNSIKNVVIVVGQINDNPGYGCYDYSKRIGDLQLAEDIDFPWRLKTTGRIPKTFIKMPTGLSFEAHYESMVLVSNRRQLLASVVDGFEDEHQESSHYLYSKILNKNSGKWSQWKKEKDFGFNGMFQIDNRVFGVDKSNNIFEFHWDNSDALKFKKPKTIKKFFNCSEILNSSSEMPLSSTMQPKITTTVATESSSKPKHETTTNVEIIETTKNMKTSDPILTQNQTQSKHSLKTSGKQSIHTSMQTKSIIQTVVTTIEPESINNSKSNIVLLIIILVVVILLIILVISSVLLIIFMRKKKKSGAKRIKLKRSEV